MTNASHQNGPRPVMVVVSGSTTGNAPLTVASLGIRLHVIPTDGDLWRKFVHGLRACEAVPAECEPLLRQVIDQLAKTRDAEDCRRSPRPSVT